MAPGFIEEDPEGEARRPFQNVLRLSRIVPNPNTHADRSPHPCSFAIDAVLILHVPTSDFLLVEISNQCWVRLHSSTSDVETHGHNAAVSLDAEVQEAAFDASVNVMDLGAIQVEKSDQSFRHEFEENGDHKVRNGELILQVLFGDTFRIDEMRMSDRSVDR